MTNFKFPKVFNWQTASDKIAKTVLNVAPAANIQITTYPGDTYIVLGKVDSGIITGLQFHLANPGKQVIGDRLIIVSQPDTSARDITYCYDDTNFYITRCGGPENPPCSEFSDGTQERDVTIFTYDGEKFCATYDNC